MAYYGRGKNKIQKPLTLVDSYNYYIKDTKLNSKYNITWEKYKEILKLFNTSMMSKIIDEGYIFKIPYRLGTIRIKKREADLTRLKANWGVFNKTDGEVLNKYLNEHTNNYYVRFYWSKNVDAVIKNKTIYSFIPSRANKRYLASLLTASTGKLQMNKYFE